MMGLCPLILYYLLQAAVVNNVELQQLWDQSGSMHVIQVLAIFLDILSQKNGPLYFFAQSKDIKIFEPLEQKSLKYLNPLENLFPQHPFLGSKGMRDWLISGPNYDFFQIIVEFNW